MIISKTLIKKIRLIKILSKALLNILALDTHHKWCSKYGTKSNYKSNENFQKLKMLCRCGKKILMVGVLMK